MVLLTCVINVRNGEKYIEETLQSVLNQTVPVKILIIDNWSTDSTVAKIEPYLTSTAIKIVHTPQPCSLGEARNYSLSLVETKYIAWLDADDLWAPNYADKVLTTLEQAPHTVYCYTGCITIDHTSLELLDNPQWQAKELIKTKPQNKLQFFETMKYALQSAWCSYTFKTSSVKEVGGFNLLFNFCEDFDLILKLLTKGNGIYVGENLAKYRVHANQLTKKISLVAQFNEKKQIARLYYQTNHLSYFAFLKVLIYYQCTLQYLKLNESFSILNLISLFFFLAINPANLFVAVKKRVYRKLNPILQIAKSKFNS